MNILGDEVDWIGNLVLIKKVIISFYAQEFFSESLGEGCPSD